MYLISQSGTTGLDYMGMDIVVNRNPIVGQDGNQAIDQQGNPLFSETFTLMVFGIGVQFPMASYETLQEAQNVFNYIHKELFKGTTFLDIREVEPKVGISRG